MNQCVITGRLVKDPEFHEVNSEKGNFHIATFVLAVRRNHSDGASFIKVKLFGTHADLANEKLSKGMKVLVSGELLTGSYISKQTNQKVYTTELSGKRQIKSVLNRKASKCYHTDNISGLFVPS